MTTTHTHTETHTRPPNIGRIVWYRTDGRNGLVYDLPAIITCTKETHPGDYPTGEKNPLPVPESETHVHLTVFTPGGFGSVLDPDGAVPEDEDWPGAPGFTPGSGTYVEWNVPYYGDDVLVDGGLASSFRTWRWPVIS